MIHAKKTSPIPVILAILASVGLYLLKEVNGNFVYRGAITLAQCTETN